MKRFSKVIFQGERGGYKVTLSKVWLKVETVSGDFSVTFSPAHRTYQFSLYCVGKEDLDALFANINLIYSTITLLNYEDFRKTVVKQGNKTIKAIYKEIDKSISKDSKDVVTEEEKTDLEWVKRATERGEMSKRERRKAEKEFQKKVKQNLDKDE